MTKSVGEVLKAAREEKDKTLQEIAETTKIKEKFLRALENSDWGALPNFSVAQGFARNYAQAVGANTSLVVALLRRDFPVIRQPQIKREMSLSRESVWTPRTTVIAVTGATLLILAVYLAHQYLQFAAPPSLSISKIEKEAGGILVSGKTTPSATVEVNGRPVLVENDGAFRVELQNQDLINSQVQVEATSRTGKKSYLSKPIN